MRLVASMMVGPGELARYLRVTVPALLDFCDLIAIRYEDEPEYEYLRGLDPERVKLLYADSPFFVHEGRARQDLLEWTLALEPTHVLAIDADEIVTDGQLVRSLLAGTPGPVWSLQMEECWELCDERICVRMDGGWEPHEVGVIWRVDPGTDYRIRDRALACGRVPASIDRVPAKPTGASLLHLGWANETERAGRYQRYVEHDGGRFHARSHLDSIMWGPERVRLAGRDWPDEIASHKAALLERIQR